MDRFECLRVRLRRLSRLRRSASAAPEDLRPASRQTRVGQQPRREEWAEKECGPSWRRPQPLWGQRRRPVSGAGALTRSGEAALDCQAIWSTRRIEPRRCGADLGRGERERERGRESDARSARSAAAMGVTSPEGSSRRDWWPHVTTSSREASDASWTASCRSCSERDMSSGRDKHRKTAAGEHTRAPEKWVRPEAGATRTGPGRKAPRGPGRRPKDQDPGAQGGPRRASTSRSVERCASRSPG